MEEYLSEAADYLETGEEYVKYEDLEEKAKRRLKKFLGNVLIRENVEIMQNPPAYVYPYDESIDPEEKVCLMFIRA